MMEKKKILAISGSTRKNSTNIQIIHAIADLYAASLQFSIYDHLTDLPFFDPDASDSNMPAAVTNFRNAISEADGVLICTPEYVFSVPGILKNALEWMVSTTIFSDKPTAIITASSMGQKAHESLLLIMKTIGVKTEDGCNLLISGARVKINEGKFSEEVLQEIRRLMQSFEKSLKAADS